MYWFFSAPGWGLIAWLACMLMVLAGGWLMVTHLFALESRERVLAGFALGLVIYLWLANWTGRILPPFWGFLGAGLLVFALGLLSAYPFRKPWLDLNDLRIGTWLTAGLALFWLWLRISKGTGLFDEVKNLAIISTLGNGQIPALAHFGQPMILRNHYGFHFLGASMMQLAHFAPWSAFDVSKSIVWSLSLLLAGLAGARYLNFRLGSVLLAAAVALAGGTRYLLLLLPSGMLSLIEQHVHLTGIASGALIPALGSILPMEASPKIGYPFALLSGINPSYMMAHGGEQTIEPMLLMLALLLTGRSRNKWTIPLFAILFSFWALAAETSYVVITIGLMALLILRYFQDGRNLNGSQRFVTAGLGLALAVPLAMVQGGVIGSMAQQIFLGTPVTGPPGAELPVGFLGFYPRWPPAILSGQMGSMPLADPWAVIAGICEMGIAILVLPWMTWRWWKGNRDNWLLQWLLPAAWVAEVVPLFLAWASDANISHIADFGLDVIVVALILMLGQVDRTLPVAGRRAFAVSAAVALALMSVPGAGLLGIQMTAAQDTLLSEHYGDAEARLLQQVWGRIPRQSKVLGDVAPANTLTGQLVGGIFGPAQGQEMEVWNQMLTAPRLQTLVENGFDFVFVNSRWWKGLDEASQDELQRPCISVFARGEDYAGGNFAEVLDLRGCR